MNGSYDLNLVLASWCMGVAAAYAVFDLGGRITGFDGLRRKLWLGASALAAGSGLWSSHFVGIQALNIPGLRFDAGLTLLSWLAAVLVCLLALSLLTRSRPNAESTAGGGLAIGLGLFLMHYAELFALRIPQLHYHLGLCLAALLVAVGLSVAALLIGAALQRLPEWQMMPAKLSGALLLGAAICGMHYIALAAARIPADAISAPQNSLPANWMGVPAALAIIGAMAAVMLLSMFDAQQLEQRWREREQYMTARFRRRLARG